MWQLSLNAVSAGAETLLIAIAFVLAYNTARFFDLAQAMLITAGGYAGATVASSRIVATVVAVGIGILLGGATHIVVYRPLVRRRTSAGALLVASLGLYLVLQATLLLTFGPAARAIPYASRGPIFQIGHVHITAAQLATCCIALAVLFATAFVLRHTTRGVVLRAIWADPELSRTMGVDAPNVTLFGILFASAVASGSGALLAWNVDVTPQTGFVALIGGVLAAVAGGGYSIPRIALAALAVAFAQQLGVWWWSSQWTATITGLALLIVLAVRRHVLGRAVY